MILVSVDLPAPLGPSSAITAPLGTAQVDAAQHLDPAVRRVQVDDLEDRDAHRRSVDRRDRAGSLDRLAGRSRVSSAAASVVGVGVAEVGLLHGGVGADLGRRRRRR